MTDLDLYVSDSVLIDKDIFLLWLRGFTVDRASNFYRTGDSVYMRRDALLHGYRAFHVLEQYLKAPRYLSGQMVFPIEAPTQSWLVEQYYSFDDEFFRAILGKKLSSRLRKDLDYITESHKIPMRSCRRQFDNLKRIFKDLEDHEGGYATRIEESFYLSRELATRYARILWMSSHRIETHKKRMASHPLTVFEKSTAAIMDAWCIPDGDPGEDLDPFLIQDLRELRITLLNDRDLMDRYKRAILARTQGQYAFKALSSILYKLLRALLNIGFGLGQSRELKDIFIDVDDKILDLIRGTGMSAEDLNQLLKIISDSIGSIRLNENPSHIRPNQHWQRYMSGIIECCDQMYRRR
eukprot:Clim_evm4s191 gene=Clim_evmTU4s191